MNEDKKSSVKVSTVIFLVIIFVLIIALIVVYYEGMLKNKTSVETLVPDNSNAQESSSSIQQENVVEQPAQQVDAKYEISYTEETYKSYRQDGSLTFENKRNLPVIKNTSNQTAADAIVKSLTDISNTKWSEITKASDEYRESPYGEGVNYLFSTHLVNGKYIVIKAEESGSFGGVAWSAEEYYNFDAKTGKLLSLSNISSTPSSFEQFIYNKIISYVNSSDMTVSTENLTKTVKDLVSSENGIWGFTEKGIEINLPKYSIGIGADGIRTILVDKSDVNQYLLDEYKY